MRGGQDAAGHGDEVRQEVDRIHARIRSGGGGQQPQLLLHLRDVTVTADAVRLDALVDLAERQLRLGLPTRPRDAALGVDHEVGDEPRPGERRERQDGRGGIAARRADDRAIGASQGRKLGPMQLRQPVHGPGQEIRRRVIEPVPAGIVGRVAEPEVGALVDDGDARVDEVGRHARRQAVWQCQEHGVRLRQGRVHDVPGPRQMGMHGPDRLLLPSSTLESHDAHIRMLVEQPDHLTARVSGGTDDADPDPGTSAKPGQVRGRSRRQGIGCPADGLGHGRPMIPARQKA